MKLTKEEALAKVSSNPKVAEKQLDMIDCMYGIGMQVTEIELKHIELDVHQDNMKKVMDY